MIKPANPRITREFGIRRDSGCPGVMRILLRNKPAQGQLNRKDDLTSGGRALKWEQRGPG